MPTSLSAIVAVLKELGGYFTFAADDGQEFVVIKKEDWDALKNKNPEKQLTLPEAPAEMSFVMPTADDILDQINRDIAMYKLAQEDEEDAEPELEDDEEELMEAEIDDIGPEPHNVSLEPEKDVFEPNSDEMGPPRRVRFEPIKGDLPPELQE